MYKREQELVSALWLQTACAVYSFVSELYCPSIIYPDKHRYREETSENMAI